jgi:hypothetical protein
MNSQGVHSVSKVVWQIQQFPSNMQSYAYDADLLFLQLQLPLCSVWLGVQIFGGWINSMQGPAQN